MAEDLTRDEVLHIARLARLRLDEEAVDGMRRELAEVLDHLARLRELDVENVEPLAHPLDLVNRLDDDRVGAAMSIEALLANAPQAEDGFFAVPKVVE